MLYATHSILRYTFVIASVFDSDVGYVEMSHYKIVVTRLLLLAEEISFGNGR